VCPSYIYDARFLKVNRRDKIVKQGSHSSLRNQVLKQSGSLHRLGVTANLNVKRARGEGET